MISATVLSRKAQEKLAKVTPAILARIKANMPGFLIRVQSVIKDKLSGAVLNRRTGTLSRSIHTQPVEQDATGVEGKVTAGVDAPYAGVHEYGGTFTKPAHTQMRTMVYGRTVAPFKVDVRAHEATYPERSFMRTALDEQRENFRKMVALSISEAEPVR